MTPADEERAHRAILAMKDAAANAAFLDMRRALRAKDQEIAELKRRLALAMWEICWSWPRYTALKPPWSREKWVIPYRNAVRAAMKEAERGR